MGRININTYKKMYESNAVAKEWLLKQGYDHIVIFGHARHGMPTVFRDGTNQVRWKPRDLFGLFDGICVDPKQGICVFFQVKTNAFPVFKDIQNFLSKNKLQEYALAINVLPMRRIRVKKITKDDVTELGTKITTFIKPKNQYNPLKNT